LVRQHRLALIKELPTLEVVAHDHDPDPAACRWRFALGDVASAQTPTYPPSGYSPLLFDSADIKYVFRLNGAPWICRAATSALPSSLLTRVKQRKRGQHAGP